MTGSRRILITGSRSWADSLTIAEVLATFDTDHAPAPTLVSGHCLPRRPDDPQGADLLCEEEAAFLGWHIERHPAPWEARCPPSCPPGHRRVDSFGKEYCPRAGLRRNERMAQLGAYRCLAFQIGDSPGARHMIACAKRAGIPTDIIRPGAVFVPLPLEDAGEWPPR